MNKIRNFSILIRGFLYFLILGTIFGAVRSPQSQWDIVFAALAALFGLIAYVLEKSCAAYDTEQLNDTIQSIKKTLDEINKSLKEKHRQKSNTEN